MTILHPILLIAGIAAVSIPILIHLLMRRRRKPIAWAAMRFLLEAYEKQRRRLQLEQLLLLALRCLAILALAAAISRPLLRGHAEADTPGITFFLIDNSIASSRIDDSGATSLDRLIVRAGELLVDLDADSERVGVISLASPAAGVVIEPSSDFAGIGRSLERIRLSDARADVAGGLDLVHAAARANPDLPVRAVLLSEFLQGSADLNRELPSPSEDADVRLSAITPPSEAVSNVAITAVVPSRRVLSEGGDLSAGVRVDLLRSGDAVQRAGTTSVRLHREGETRVELGRVRVPWSPGQQTASALIQPAQGGFEPGDVVLVASIDRDSIPADDTRATLIEFKRALRVGLVAYDSRVGGEFVPSDWIRAALDPLADLGDIEITTLSPVSLDIARLSAFDAVVITRPDQLASGTLPSLRTFLDRGGLIIATPQQSVGAHVWTEAFQRAFDLPWIITPEPADLTDTPASLALGPAASTLLDRISAEADFLLPGIEVTRLLSARADDPAVVLATDDGAPLVLTLDPTGTRTGLFVQFLVALDAQWTNLPAKPFFVPLVQEVLREGVSRGRRDSTIIAGAAADIGERDWTSLPMVGEGDRRPVPEAWRSAGVFRLYDAEDRPTDLRVVLPDVAGSNADRRTRDEVSAWLASASSQGEVRWDEPEGDRSASDGSGSREARHPVSTVAFVLALLCVVGECVLAKFFTRGEAAA